ncbi:MAG: aminotransferase class I/II-fold pyridoxal phosphate-dependent enzyme [Lachnospiraceae bacterium]|nr:aminotransferase class I/II-fold pyridoxal phosphate-dependent enzyme [Lachnospiraceae bacterium]
MRRYIAEGLYEYICEYHSVWHMPGHKRKKFSDDRSSLDMVYMDDLLDHIYTIDVTEVQGTDDLHNPTEMIKSSEEELAKVYRTFASYYLVNGSTGGIMAAVSACCKAKDKIIIADNCHKSVHNIAKLLGLEIIYIPFSDSDYLQSVSVDEVKNICARNPDAKAIVITSPTYEGIVSDIKSISEIAKAYDMKLIADEAHGALLPFIAEQGEHKDIIKFPQSSIYLGADIVIESLHKTLPSMTQTAILHVQNETMDKDIRKYLSVFMSSSPSYVMLCSMERAVAVASGWDYTTYIRELKDFRDKFKFEIKHFSLLDKDCSDKIFAYDSTRLVIRADKIEDVKADKDENGNLTIEGSLTGAALESILSDRYGIVCEMSGEDYVVLISTMVDERKDLEYLYNSIKEIDENFDSIISDRKSIMSDSACHNGEYIKTTIRILDTLEGTIAKDNIYVYPPGIYLVKKGESYTEEKLDILRRYVRSGKQLHGEL